MRMAVRTPSASAPSSTSTRTGCRLGTMVNSSARVISYCTARPVRRTASVTTSSVSSSCLPPNPPPTRPVRTRTRSGDRSKMCAISLRTRYGTWVLVRSTRRPSSSSQPRVAWVSSAAWETRLVRYVPLTRWADDASAALTEPISSCSCATTLRPGSEMRASGPLSPWTSGAPGRRASAGSTTAGSTSYSTRSSARARSASRSDSATTTATRWPRNRRTGSSTRVSSGSSRRDSWRAVEKSVAGESSWVRTARTPGAARASAASIDTIRAWACGLPSTARCARSVAGTSSVKGSRPATIRRAAGERTERPASCPASGSTVLRRRATASQMDR